MSRTTRSSTSKDNIIIRKLAVNEELQDTWIRLEKFQPTSQSISIIDSEFPIKSIQIVYHDHSTQGNDLFVTTIKGETNASIDNVIGDPITNVDYSTFVRKNITFHQLDSLIITVDRGTVRRIKGIDSLIRAYSLSDKTITINDKIFSKEDIGNFLDSIYKLIIFCQKTNESSMVNSQRTSRRKTNVGQVGIIKSSEELFKTYAYFIYRIADRVGRIFREDKAIRSLLGNSRSQLDLFSLDKLNKYVNILSAVRVEYEAKEAIIQAKIRQRSQAPSQAPLQAPPQIIERIKKETKQAGEATENITVNLMRSSQSPQSSQYSQAGPSSSKIETAVSDIIRNTAVQETIPSGSSSSSSQIEHNVSKLIGQASNLGQDKIEVKKALAEINIQIDGFIGFLNSTNLFDIQKFTSYISWDEWNAEQIITKYKDTCDVRELEMALEHLNKLKYDSQIHAKNMLKSNVKPPIYTPPRISPIINSKITNQYHFGENILLRIIDYVKSIPNTPSDLPGIYKYMENNYYELFILIRYLTKSVSLSNVNRELPAFKQFDFLLRKIDDDEISFEEHLIELNNLAKQISSFMDYEMESDKILKEYMMFNYQYRFEQLQRYNKIIHDNFVRQTKIDFQKIDETIRSEAEGIQFNIDELENLDNLMRSTKLGGNARKKTK